MIGYFPTEELRQENERLMALFLDTKENVDVDEFIEKNASAEYKKYLKDDQKRKKELSKKGIMV